MADADEWSSDANRAITISLVQPGAGPTPKAVARFSPSFTYPIFGDAQTIFGYQGLRISLRFASHDLRPSVSVAWEKQYKPVGDTKAVDVRETLERWLPPTAFEPPSTFDERVQSDAAARDFRPPGERLTTYEVHGKTFEIWHAAFTDLAVQQILKRMQIFVPFFIEGGTYINLDDPDWTLQRWRVYFLYEKAAAPATPDASAYSIVGYCTVYRYFLYTPSTREDDDGKRISKPATATYSLPLPPVTPAELPCRQRISQFLILPPYQGKGHGSLFYTSLATAFVADPAVREITVEDPNEAFDDLRDYCDLARLRQHAAFTSLGIDTDVPIARKGPLPTALLLPQHTLARLRGATKLAPRQFARLVELQLLSTIPAAYHQASRPSRRADPADARDRAYQRWRLLVKQRLYKFNRTQLEQLDRLERIDKLEEALGGVEGDYERLLRGVAGAAAATAAAASSSALPEAHGLGPGEAEADAEGKRKSPPDDAGGPAAKRLKGAAE
ncbi:MAG: histone acetyltransferase 1 [Thelocarpon impressellum]|nr:MAG: histone acetyltransferase 1 [Thelocarpon impressellum]